MLMLLAAIANLIMQFGTVAASSHLRSGLRSANDAGWPLFEDHGAVSR
jgi:hypothetical protein